MDSEVRLDGVDTLSSSTSQAPVHPFLHHLNTLPTSVSGGNLGGSFSPSSTFHSNNGEHDSQMSVDEHHEQQTLLSSMDSYTPWSVNTVFPATSSHSHHSGMQGTRRNSCLSWQWSPFSWLKSLRPDFSSTYLSSPSVQSLPSGDGYLSQHILTNRPSSSACLIRCNGIFQLLWSQVSRYTVRPISKYVSISRNMCGIVILTIFISLFFLSLLPASQSLQSLIINSSTSHPQQLWLPTVKGLKSAPYIEPIVLNYMVPKERASNIVQQNAYFKQQIQQLDVSETPQPLPVLLNSITRLKQNGATHILLAYGGNFPYSGMQQLASDTYAYNPRDVQMITTHCLSLNQKQIQSIPIIEDMQFLLRRSRWSHLVEVDGDLRYANQLHGRVEALWRDLVLQQLKAHTENIEAYTQLGYIFPNKTATTDGVVSGVYIGGKPLHLSSCLSCSEGVDEDNLVANRYTAACTYVTSLTASDQHEESYSSVIQSTFTQGSGQNLNCYVNDGQQRTWGDKELSALAATYPKVLVSEGSATLTSRVPLLRYHQWNKYAGYFGMANLIVSGMYLGSDMSLATTDPQGRLENAAAWNVLATHYQITSGALLGPNQPVDHIIPHRNNVPNLSSLPYAAMQSRAMQNKMFDRDDRREVFGSFQLRTVPFPPKSLSFHTLKHDFHEFWAEAVLISLTAPVRVENQIKSSLTNTMLVDGIASDTKNQVLLTLSMSQGKTVQSQFKHIEESHSHDFGSINTVKLYPVLYKYLSAQERKGEAPVQLPITPYNQWNPYGTMLVYTQMIQSIINEYGGSTVLWNETNAPQSIRIVALFSCTVMAQYFPLHVMAAYVDQYIGVNLQNTALDTLQKLVHKKFHEVTRDIPLQVEKDLIRLEDDINTNNKNTIDTNNISTNHTNVHNNNQNNVNTPMLAQLKDKITQQQQQETTNRSDTTPSTIATSNTMATTA